MRALLIAGVVALLAGAGALPAQERAPISGAGAAGRRQPPAGLERRFQERLIAVVRNRLRLNDEQVTRLREVASRTEDDRRQLRRDEVAARLALRQELLAGDQANEGRVAALLEELPGLERRRIDLLEREQRDLSRFLSPVQRARYLGLQDELRRSMQELQQQRLRGGADDEPLGRLPPVGGRRRMRPPPP